MTLSKPDDGRAEYEAARASLLSSEPRSDAGRPHINSSEQFDSRASSVDKGYQ